MNNFFANLSLKVIPFTAYIIIKSISKTLRLEIINTAPTLQGKKEGKNFIFAFWHNNFFIMPYIYSCFLPGCKIAVLTSRSHDGEYISRVMEKFDFLPVRGSSSKGGKEALRLLLRQLETGNDIAVTPDGPRGPRHKVQPGIIALAQLSGRAIIPVAYKMDRKKTLNTWDKFIIPSLFSKGQFRVGQPITVPRNISSEQKEEYQKQLEGALLDLA